LFHSMDKNGSGSIEYDELLIALRVWLGFNLLSKHLRSMILIFDWLFYAIASHVTIKDIAYSSGVSKDG
jgi:Ca2+-binding EF-hand superfamily protein